MDLTVQCNVMALSPLAGKPAEPSMKILSGRFRPEAIFSVSHGCEKS